MTTLYGRTCEVIVGKPPPDNFVEPYERAISVKGLRITFEIEKTDTPEPNKAKISIWNLSPASRQALTGSGVKVVLLAGYQGQNAQLFSGDARHPVENIQQGADWETRVTGGTAERAFQWARSNESFSAGASVIDIMVKVAKTMVSDPGNLVQVASNAVAAAGRQAELAGGYVACGRSSDQLTTLLRPYGLSWSIQDGRLEVLGEHDTVNDDVPEISERSGLEGSPELQAPPAKGKPSLLKVKSRLFSIRPGQRFRLSSRNITGLFKARKVRFKGDTHGPDWSTEIDASMLST